MSDIDHGIAASIGAALGGAVVGVREWFARRKKPELPEPPNLAGRVGRLYEHVTSLEQEQKNMRHEIAMKLDKLSESVEELSIARAKTDELLPIIREQLKEMRDDLRDQRRKE